MTNQKEIEDLRSAIVSQLATCKPSHGISLDSVNKDYYEFNDEYIPYSRYGFTTLVDFLKTIPEIDLYPCGGRHYINFKGKESFKHVSDLVARTQKKPSRNYKGQANRSRSVSMRKTIPSGYRPPQDYYKPQPTRDSSSSSSFIDPVITNHILSIIKEHPSGLYQSEILEKVLYRSSYLKLSNQQLQEHLKVLDRDIVIKDKLFYPKRSSSHETFAERSKRSRSVPSRRYNQGKYSDESNGSRNNYNNDNNNYNNADNNYGNNNGQYGNNNYENNYYQNTSTEGNNSQNVVPKNFKVAGIDTDDDLECEYPDLDADLDSGGPSFASGEINGFRAVDGPKNPESYQCNGNSVEPVKIISDSREVNNNYNNNNDKHHSEIKNKKINFNQHDSSYNTVRFADHHNNYNEMSVGSNYHHDLEATNITANNTTDNAVTGEYTPVAGHFDHREALFQKSLDFVAESVSQRTLIRLQKLLENNPNGIWCLELEDLYEKEYKLTLEWKDFGFHRLSDFVSHLPKIFHKVGPYRRGDYRLFDARKPIPDDDIIRKNHQKLTTASYYNIYGETEPVESLPRYISNDIREKLFPDDVINIHETVGYISVTRFEPPVDERGEKTLQNIEVHVVEAFDPSFFWIQLSRNKPMFQEMMDRLGEFYSEHSSKYAIPQILLEKGLNVVCKFYGVWHRGMIKSISPTFTSIKIHFYDFGTMKCYRPDDLFFLKRSFAILPAQAIPCGLGLIKPKTREGEDGGWSTLARDTFVTMAFKCEMWATVFKVDVENNSMLIGLTDTSEEEDIHLADYLIRNKFAEKCKTELVVNPNDMSLYIEDYGENSTSSVPELPQPITPNNYSSPPIGLSSASPSIQNLSAVVHSVLSPNVSAAIKWEVAKDQIIQVLDQFTQSTLKTYKSMVVAERESIAVNIIKSLYDVYARLIYQTICPNSHCETPTEIYTPNQSVYENPTSTPLTHDLLKLMKDQSLSDIQSNSGSDATLTNENQNDVSILKEPVNNFSPDESSNPVTPQPETTRTQLENSISNVSHSFFSKLAEQNLQLQKSDSVTDELIETNPFKRDFISTETKVVKIPPPLPPRPKKLVIEPVVTETNSNPPVYRASPVLYDIPEKIINDFEVDTNDDNQNEDKEIAAFYSEIKKVEPIDFLNYSIPVYNNVLVNPVGINKKRTSKEGYDEDSWDSTNSYYDRIDATSAESIEKDSSQSCNENKSKSDDKLNKTNEDKQINDSFSSAANKKCSEAICVKTVKLSVSDINIYHFDNTGWILIDQYRSVFTVYDDNKYILNMIDMKSTNVPVKKITAKKYPQIFEQYSKINETFAEDINYLKVLDLIPISHVLKLSQKLGVVSRDEIERVKSGDYDYQMSPKMADLFKLMSSNVQGKISS